MNLLQAAPRRDKWLKSLRCAKVFCRVRRPVHGEISSGCPVVAPSIALAVALITIAGPVRADEGLWLFNRPPRKQLEERYDFKPTPQWLEHVQKSCVRFNDGGSGSFVSADGLVMANQHVGADVLPKLGDATHNYYRDGFYAKTRADEKRCDGLELDVLVGIEDVTARVSAAVTSGMTSEQASTARRAVTTEIENESAQRPSMHGEVVTLYQGGEYHLYRYRRYTDIRVAFAPEQQIAFFGGDPDNFEYPRYDFDVYFFRVYEAGQPAKVEHYLKWSQAGATENELVLVPGHPRHTNRLATVAALSYQRDTGLPNQLRRMYHLEVQLSAWSGRSEENARKAKELLFRMQDGRKALDGELAGLLDPALLDKKQADEGKFRAAVARDPKLNQAVLQDGVGAWDRIAQAQRVRKASLRDYSALEEAGGFNSILFDVARMLLRASQERARPDRDRLSEYTNARLPSLEPALFSTQPIDKEYETFKLADSLTWLAAQFRNEPQFVEHVLGGKSPLARAFELVHGTQLEDLSVRKRLYEAGESTVAASRDPLIQLARLVDSPSRAVRKLVETQVDEVERQAYAQIAKAMHALGGSDTYPDATFTLRLAFGTVRGYEEQAMQIPFETTFAGLYERSREHHGRPPFNLPERWIDRRNRLELKTPFNFLCMADIVGGNSGSPVINRDAEIVGVIFDRNLQSLVLDYLYTDKQARALAVHSRAITEALRNVYDADQLTNEILGRHL
jgi:hypothetical protein